MEAVYETENVTLVTSFSVYLSPNLPLGTSGIQSNPQLTSVIGSSVKRVNCVLGIALVKVPAASRDRIKIQLRQQNEWCRFECRTQNYYQERKNIFFNYTIRDNNECEILFGSCAIRAKSINLTLIAITRNSNRDNDKDNKILIIIKNLALN